MSFENWEDTKLVDVTSKIGDGLHGTPKYDENGDYYFINGNNLKNGKVVLDINTKRISKEEFKKIKKPLGKRTIFVAINGTLGNSAVYNNEDIALGKSACYLNVKEDVSKSFIRYVIEDPSFQKYAELFATGATIKNLSLKAVRNYKFKLPPLEIQKKIAKKLSNYDDLIENNQKQIELLEKKARLTYEEWFLRFRIDGKKLDIDEDTGLPFGWEKMNISDAISINPTTSLKRDKEAFYVPMSALSETNMLIDGVEKRIPQSGAKFKNYDTLLARITPSLENGKTGFVQFLKDDEIASGSTEFIVMRETKYVSPYYIYLLARSDSFRDLAILSMSGSDGRQRVKPEIFKKAKINISTSKFMKEFHLKMEVIFEKIYNLQKQNKKLKEARDILLPRLMSGMIEL